MAATQPPCRRRNNITMTKLPLDVIFSNILTRLPARSVLKYLSVSKQWHLMTYNRYTEALSESEDSGGGHWKSRSKKKKSSGKEDDLSQPWVYEETYPFTPRIRYFDFLKTRMPRHIKTYDGSEDPEDHLKIFQAAAKTERWSMPTWCHMFNSTLTGNARKYIKDSIELHNIKQWDGESTKDFVRRYKLESRDVKGAQECLRIFGFVHRITNPELIKRLHDKIPKTVDEMIRVTTSFLKGDVAASNQEKKKTFPSWKQHESSQKQNFKKGGFWNQQRLERKQDRFSLLIKTPKEIFALDKRKFKAPPPMTTPVEKRNHAKFCKFHGEVGHNTDECMHLRKQIEEMLKGRKLEDEGTEGPMIIEAEIEGHFVHRMYVDGGSASKIRDEEHSALSWMNFMVVRSQSPYNGIIRKPGVRKLQAVSSTAHGMLKIPVEGGVITLKSRKLVPLECVMVSGPEETPSAAKPIIEEKVKVAINPEYLEQTPTDMTGVLRHIREHRLNVREGCSPVRQKKRGQAADRNQAIQEKVGKLVGARIMREVHYHDWLSNPVMVKKHDGSWRMCVDFKDLNKACPKDGYPLPKIDWKVESLCRFPFKCFLNAYKGYHQIQMETEDEDKTTFITSQGIFCYTKMPFGLRNAGATYQRLVDKAMILESVEHDPLLWPTVEEDGVTRLKKYSELSAAEAIQADCDVKAINIILQGLPSELYALASTHKFAKEMWERIQMLMQGTSLTKQERECKLYDEFDKFAYQKGETLRDFYLRFSLLLNDMNMYNMKLEQF
nr:reverse transcriptase domain-containing protein [Tanacetum cinerariifolium]